MTNRFKNLILISMMMAFGSLTMAQNSKSDQKREAEKSQDLNLQLLVYRNALKCSDYYTAIIALNYVVALEANSGKYRDSLAFMYHAANNYFQALYWSDEVLKENASNIGMLEIKANCLKQTKQYVKSIEVFEKLVELTESPIHAFNLIELQYQIKRLYECVASTELADRLKFTEEMLYAYKIDETQSRNARLISAFYNFRGLALFELGSKDLAKKAFELSVAADTSFILARLNLNAVNNDLIAEKNKENSMPKDNKNVSPESSGIKKNEE